MSGVVHDHSISIDSSGHHQLAQIGCNAGLLALPYQRNDIAVWNMSDFLAKPIVLEGHGKPVSALAFSHLDEPCLLASCAEDYVIIWNMQSAQLALNTGQQIKGNIMAQLLGSIQFCVFDYENTRLAVCAQKHIHVLRVNAENHNEMLLQGHQSAVNAAEFSPFASQLLVSVSDDRTFKVWDLDVQSAIYQSCILSSSPLTCLSFNPYLQALAVGSDDGTIRVYNTSGGSGFKQMHQLDCARILSRCREAEATLQETKRKELEVASAPKVINSRATWQRPTSAAFDPLSALECNDPGASILSIAFVHQRGMRPTSARPGSSRTGSRLSFLQDDSLMRELLKEPPTMTVLTMAAILQVNSNTLEVYSYVSLLEPVESSSSIENSYKVLGLMATCTTSLGQYGPFELTWCAMKDISSKVIHIVRVNEATANDKKRVSTLLAMARPDGNIRTGKSTTQKFSVLSSDPLLENSPLRSQIINSANSSQEKKKTGNRPNRSIAGARGANVATNQPLTFQDKIKSSGYASETKPHKMFQPKLNKAKSTAIPSKTGKPATNKNANKSFPMDSAPPAKLRSKIDVAERPTVVNCAKFSGSGKSVACALANNSAQVFQLPLDGRGLAFVAHDASVTSVGWSLDHKWLITSSEDKSAAVWSLGLSDPVMTITSSKGNVSSKKENDKFELSKPVRHAQFYFMDQFLLLSSGNSIYLYKYNLDPTKSDIKRYLSNNKYKAVISLEMESAHLITALSTINSFYSYIVFAAGSDKSLELFDMNVGMRVFSLKDFHSRTCHAIQQNEGSLFSSKSAASCDLFATAAAGDCIKLWDLRTNRCVQRYEGHNNRVYPCGLDLSPCGRFLATGSEDRTAYVYDVRMGSPLEKLTGHTDTVGSVAFHPLHPMLLTASLDGRLRMFST